MVRGGKAILKNFKRRRVETFSKGSDGSDEDYVLDEDLESNGSEGCASDGNASDGNASDESFGSVAVEHSFDEEEEEEEELEKKRKRVGRSKGSMLKNDIFLDEKRTRVRQPIKRIRVSDDEEDYDIDEKDDEEFMPDGIDCVDEEEYFQVKKSNKPRKPVSRKRVSVKRRRRKTSAKGCIKKKPLKKKRKRTLVVKKSESSDDDFVVSDKVVWEKRKKKGKKQTKRRGMIDWDSDSACSESSDDDFAVRHKAVGRTNSTKIVRKRTKKTGNDWDSESACSEPSEVEYTISEEEKELLKEANNFCGNMTPSLRNCSLSKRLQVDVAPNCQQQKPTRRKGKTKVGDPQNDSGKQVCGICLSEEGKDTVQGTLNCCSHFFCFGCIMEWSKVESRCPLCKQRFVRITKPARSDVGIDLRDAVIQVPQRDQVYRPSEEEMRGYFDPYENVVCIECHQGGNDSLMLLCDICDSAAHTFCVGLGVEVPEGNWFCKGCRVMEPGSSNAPVQDPVPDQGPSNFSVPSDLSTGGTPAEDINPPSQYSVSVPEPSFSQLFENFPSPRYPILEDANAPSPYGIGASTLSGRRRVYRHMHDIRSSNRAERFSRTAGDETSSLREETAVGNSFAAVREDQEQDASASSLQDEELLSARLNHFRQSTQGSGTAIASGSATASEQVQHCISRPFIRTDDSISPHTCRESSCFREGAI